MVTQPDQRLAAVYHTDPPAFVEAMRVAPNSADNFTAALDASSDVTPTGLVAKLIALKPLDIDYQQIPMSEVIDYNKFYLAEHDLYCSSRLGIRSYWPNQYVYEWDATKTAAQNTDLLNASEFNYRRPWYSKVYNSLIGSPNPAPYGNAYVQPLYSERVLGQKQYELTNHLGNVMAVVTDKISEKKQNPNSSLPTLAEKHASLFAAYDYYPFGMPAPPWRADAGAFCTGCEPAVCAGDAYAVCEKTGAGKRDRYEQPCAGQPVYGKHGCDHDCGTGANDGAGAGRYGCHGKPGPARRCTGSGQAGIGNHAGDDGR